MSSGCPGRTPNTRHRRRDARVPGTYRQVTNLNYATRVMAAYLERHAPNAIAASDLEKLARVHSGGPTGPHRTATNAYWR
jgi:hypothetical protein